MLSVEERFWPKVKRWDPGGCWGWAAGKRHGYGQFYDGDRMVPSHRFAYELVVGPIPEGMELDHLCRNPECVNPKHLEPVSHRTNILRGTAPSAVHARKTHCPQGHPYSGRDNRGGRVCHTCDADRHRAARCP